MHNYSQKEKHISKFQQINYRKQAIEIILVLKNITMFNTFRLMECIKHNS